MTSNLTFSILSALASQSYDLPESASSSSRADTHYMFSIPPGIEWSTRRSGYFQQARRAEVDREVAKAIAFYERAVYSDDRVDQSLKDLVALLHILGRIDEATAFVQRCMQFGPWFKGYHSMLRNLEILSSKAPIAIHFRCIAAEPCCSLCFRSTLPCSHHEPISRGSLKSASFLRSALPTFQKLMRVMVKSQGAILEFNSHTSAKRTLEVHLPGSRLRWISPGEDVHEYDFSMVKKLPVIVPFGSSPEKLVESVLAHCGAFEDASTREASPTPEE